jgi:hypothetical protein
VETANCVEPCVVNPGVVENIPFAEPCDDDFFADCEEEVEEPESNPFEDWEEKLPGDNVVLNDCEEKVLVVTRDPCEEKVPCLRQDCVACIRCRPGKRGKCGTRGRVGEPGCADQTVTFGGRRPFDSFGAVEPFYVPVGGTAFDGIGLPTSSPLTANYTYTGLQCTTLLELSAAFQGSGGTSQLPVWLTVQVRKTLSGPVLYTTTVAMSMPNSLVSDICLQVPEGFRVSIIASTTNPTLLSTPISYPSLTGLIVFARFFNCCEKDTCEEKE